MRGAEGRSVVMSRWLPGSLGTLSFAAHGAGGGGDGGGGGCKTDRFCHLFRDLVFAIGEAVNGRYPEHSWPLR
jgi:hypothetical protein